MWNPRVITTDALQLFLQRGGQIEYRPVHTPKGYNWELWGVHVDGSSEPVVSSKTGETRMFKSADAVLAFHLRIYPDQGGVFIPAPKSDKPGLPSTDHE
ncbi:hypothetical protein D0Z66_21880 (plasmid) [Cereibacter sphaeroides]|nr:hypothetical protein D0Z66_21880 [Cereibacter sphaeroides]